jgi:hypothetical protein
MNSIQNSTEHLWVLCHNGSGEIIHTIELFIGGNLDTGQLFMETFATEEEMNNRVLELNPDYFKPLS